MNTRQNNRFKLLIIAGFLGVIYSAFLLYKRRGGYFISNDFISLVIVFFLVAILLFYLKKRIK